MRMPWGTSTILVSSLSMAITEVSRPECVYLRPIRSIRPWTVPSSPGVPCRALNTTSGLASRRRSATSRPMSMRVTRCPNPSSASATPAPLSSDTSRSDDQPPISTATCTSRHSYALNFPFQLDAGMGFDPPPHFLAERLDIGRTRLAQVEQEVAMLFRDLRVADGEAPAACRVDELPGLGAGRVLEGRAAGAAAQGLRRLPLLGDPVHLGGDAGAVARYALEQGFHHHRAFRHLRMAIGVAEPLTRPGLDPAVA